MTASVHDMDWCEVLEPAEFLADPALCARYLDALEGHHLRYLRGRDGRPPLVHPGMLMGKSNITNSPTYSVGPNEAHLHSREEVQFLNPAYVGSRLCVTWQTAERYEKRGRPYLVTAIVVVDQDGREILRRKQWNTKSTGAMPVPAGAVQPERPAPRVRDEGAPLSARDMALRGRPMEVTLERMRLFSGWPKRNVHTDEEVARAAGAPAPIASAVQPVGHLCDLMLEHFGEEWLRGGSLSLVFRRAVYPGDAVTWHGVIAAMDGDAGATRYDLEVWCENQDGGAVTVGRAVARAT